MSLSDPTQYSYRNPQKRRPSIYNLSCFFVLRRRPWPSTLSMLARHGFCLPCAVCSIAGALCETVSLLQDMERRYTALAAAKDELTQTNSTLSKVGSSTFCEADQWHTERTSLRDPEPCAGSARGQGDCAFAQVCQPGKGCRAGGEEAGGWHFPLLSCPEQCSWFPTQ